MIIGLITLADLFIRFLLIGVALYAGLSALIFLTMKKNA